MQDDVSIDTFVQKQRERHRRIRSEGISWADEPSSLLERFGRLIEHPALVTYSRVCTAGMVGVIGLASIITMIGAFG